jgi:hypothetical protein
MYMPCSVRFIDIVRETFLQHRMIGMQFLRTPGLSALLLAAVMATILAGCGDSPSGPPPPPAVASVTIEPATPGLVTGQSMQLTATARAADGTAISGKQFTWATQNGTVASVSTTGFVIGLSAGTAVITAGVDGRTGQTTVTVVDPSPVIITGVSPDPLQAGGQVTITGSGFNPSAAGNAVTIGGVAAQVLTASTTSITAAVPSTVCRPTGNITIRVAVGSDAGEAVHPYVTTAQPLQVGVGQQVRLDPAVTYCIQLAAGAAASEFLIGVQSISETATALTPARVEIAVPGSAPPPAAVAAPSAFAFATGPGEGLPSSAAAGRRARHRADHIRHQARQMEFLAARRPSTADGLRTFAGQAGISAAIPGTVVVGDTVDVKYPQTCSAFTPLRAVVRRVGTHGLWVEDVANPTGGFSAADYQSLGEQFDNAIAATNIAYFGEPTDFDGNGRIVIVITKEINKDEAPTLGRVYPLDFFPADCAASNGGEYFYGIAPDPTGAVSEAYAVADAILDMPFIIAHEMAHVIQIGRRLTTPGATVWQSIWELEGQATFAEEVVGHAVTGNAPYQNYGFAVAWNSPETTPVDWYINGFVDLALFFGFESQTTAIPDAPEVCGWLDREVGPCIGRRSVYGVPWSFLRWVSDQYGPSFPGGEQGLHRAFVQDTRTGFETISGVVGQPIDLLLARWAAALYMDDRIPETHPSLRFTSWNMTDIFSRLFETARLRPRQRGFAASADNVSVRSGSTAYFRVFGSAGHPAGAVSVTGTGGASLPGHMRVWVVRIQ